MGSRAYQAARAGLDWGAYRVLDPLNTTATSGTAALPNCPGAATSTCPTSAAPLSASVPTSPFTATVLAGHTVTLQCSCTDHTEAGRNIRVFQLKSTATSGSGLQRSGAPALGSRRLLPRPQRQPREPASLRVQLMRVKLLGCAAALPRRTRGVRGNVHVDHERPETASNTGSWSCGAVPTAADDVVIDNGDAVAVNVAKPRPKRNVQRRVATT